MKNKLSPEAKSRLDQENINSDTPIRLRIAAQLAFPDGSMTISVKRKPFEVVLLSSGLPARITPRSPISNA